MIKPLSAVILTVLALSSHELPGQSSAIQSGVTVTFRKEVSDAEALWMLRSYRVQFDIIRRRVSHLQITADDSSLRDRTEDALISASTGGVLGHSVIRRSSIVFS